MDTHLNEEEQLLDTNPTTPLVSITSWLDDDESQGGHPLSVLRLSTEPAYVSLFTDQGCDVETHYLEAADGWSGGYVHCLGKGCPACMARIERKRFLLLPVADLPTLRSSCCGCRPRRGRVVCEPRSSRYSRSPTAPHRHPDHAARDFHHTVEAHRNDALAPDVANAIKRFVGAIEAGSIDLKSVVTSMTGPEMAEHERVAKRLSLEGPGA